MEFKPIRPKKIYEEIVSQIKAMIAHGELTPGSKLMPERELAERLQVGRSAVREAYRALEAIGIIEIRPGEGTFVREIGTKSMTDIMSLAVVTGKDTLFELLELRKIVETEAAALAALRRTEEDIQKIKYWLDKMHQDIVKGVSGEVNDLKLHYAVTDAAHNSLLIRIMNSVSETMENVMKAVRERLYQSQETSEILYQHHEQIYQAIKKGDQTEARHVMMNHLVSTEKVLMQIMKNQ
ncbi:FadR/GntR family transcriptional regulator [Desulforamulus aeronauticus]|uniref:Transcriptional regulator, GntR family n=1 Tax=Desulforamulus aeronauticus DSM 10349 TaxID=1121421 RepID=A0A1M6PX22_9FIRM|nr:FadR/GntR family transcriptional regulator [Desulforamulus aeronauticus]SHK12513.1 transcriptional regulator, GntR family [Desulforamulus aeronauticus DSM 10349]